MSSDIAYQRDEAIVKLVDTRVILAQTVKERDRARDLAVRLQQEVMWYRDKGGPRYPHGAA